MNIKYTLSAAFGAALLIQTPRVIAQDATPSPSASPSATAAADGGPGRQRGGNFADFRQRMNDRVKSELKATDDEWAVIQPLLEKVQDAQMATMAGRFGGMRRGIGMGGPRPDASPAGSPAAQSSPGSNGGQGGNRFGRPSSPEADALHTVLENENASADDIKAKLQALRDVRTKATADLQTARENLKKVLTLRQEAILVQMGVLD